MVEFWLGVGLGSGLSLGVGLKLGIGLGSRGKGPGGKCPITVRHVPLCVMRCIYQKTINMEYYRTIIENMLI